MIGIHTVSYHLQGSVLPADKVSVLLIESLHSFKKPSLDIQDLLLRGIIDLLNCKRLQYQP